MRHPPWGNRGREPQAVSDTSSHLDRDPYLRKILPAFTFLTMSRKTRAGWVNGPAQKLGVPLKILTAEVRWKCPSYPAMSDYSGRPSPIPEAAAEPD